VRLALISFFIFFLIHPISAEVNQEEKEMENLNFQNIQSVLKKDGLAKEVVIKKKKIQKIKVVKNKIEKGRFFYPKENELWGIASEIWLIKNAQVLGWDFEKPEYGLEVSFRNLLEKLGYIQKKFKILILNTPTLVRAALPGVEGEAILLISLPFVRSLDLSKMEISLLLLEDFFRLEANFVKNGYANKNIKELAGSNFKGSKPDIKLIEGITNYYSDHFYEKGFSFQNQFEITKKMDAFLKSTPDIWGMYYRLLGKLDRFLKSNIQYKNYLKLYPSPEMQVKWLSPEDKVL